MAMRMVIYWRIQFEMVYSPKNLLKMEVANEKHYHDADRGATNQVKFWSHVKKVISVTDKLTNTEKRQLYRLIKDKQELLSAGESLSYVSKMWKKFFSTFI